MIKNFKVEGLNCANCASSLEDEISKIDGVKQVSINFMMEKMSLEYDGNLGEQIVDKVKKVINDEEKDVLFEEI